MERIDRDLIGGSNMISCAILADLHWGARDPLMFWSELNDGFFDQIPEEGFDAIFLAGDLFDMKESFPSQTVKYVILFIHRLLSVCQDLFIIEGTRGHDSLQTRTIELIFSLTERNENIHVYQRAAEVNYCGMKVLLLPEEFVEDADKYYAPYLGEGIAPYDLIIGHGMIDQVWYAKTNEEKLKLNHAVQTPVFSLDTLLAHGNRIFFGHVHENKNYKDRFTYVGPFTRWEFDKEWDPGFYAHLYCIDDGSWSDMFYPNKFAPILHTENLSIRQDYSPEQLSEKMGKILALAKQCDRLRIRVIIDRDLATFSQMKDSINDMAKAYPNVVVVYRVLEPEEEIVGEDRIRERKTLKLQQTPEDVRIQEYVKKKRGLDIPLERICEVTGYQREENENG